MSELEEQSLHARIAMLGLEQKVALLTGQDSWTLRAIPEIGLRSIVMSDGPAGVRGTRWDERDPSCNFPSPTALGASWDPARVRAVGNGLGIEARRKGVDVLLAPTINLQRTPYGGRHFEMFSEDPVLTADLATAYVEGVQELGVGATVKHYVANDSETDRFTVDVLVDERALRELYLLAFERPIVEGGAWLVMSAYNSINGVTASENDLLTVPLSTEWEFDGVVVSDWTAVRSIESARHPQDLAMPGPHGAWGDRLVAAVRDGTIDEEIIDAKVLRILRLAARVGALEGIGSDRPAVPVVDIRKLARSASTDGMVLLTNDGTLPLAEPTSIAVLGEGARFARTQGGGSATVVPASVVSPVDGIRRRWPNARVDWAWGAVVQPTLTEFEAGTYTTPDGLPGLLVRYLDGANNLIGTEVRASTSLVWFNGTSLGARSEIIEFSFSYEQPDEDDDLLLGLAGVSDYEVIVEGESVAMGALRTDPNDDPSSVVLNPPSTAVRVAKQGVGSLAITVRFRPVRGGMPDALSLRVGLAAPEVDPQLLIDDAVSLASAADVAVVVVGTSGAVESEGFDRDSLQLPGSQDDLVRAVAAVNPQTVVVVNSGAPVVAPWRDEVSAVLVAWFPGQEFGDALADVLSGDIEPGGRLPMTWPADEAGVPIGEVVPVDGRLEYSDGIHIGYRAWLRSDSEPAFSFGHGLGYTEWHLSGITASPLEAGESIASVEVQNVGSRPGKCVVQFYLERISRSTVDRPARWLAAFRSVRVDGGESTTVSVTLPSRRFAHWEVDRWRVEPGEYRIVAARSSADPGVSTTIDVAPGTGDGRVASGAREPSEVRVAGVVD